MASSIMEKYIFNTYSELSTFLVSKGFTINNGNMKWAAAGNTNCHWSITGTSGAEKISFVNSKGQNAFRGITTQNGYIVDFAQGKCACIFIPLIDDGCILFLSKVANDFDIANLAITCENNWTYDDSTWVYGDNDLENGLVVCTPAEDDDKWRYSWRDMDSRSFYWDIDDGDDSVTKGTELPSKEMYNVPLTATLVKIRLNSGYWSHYIFNEVMGTVYSPGVIITVNGQRFIVLTDNDGVYRCPAFRLPAVAVTMNPSIATNEYSQTMTYNYNDYCIYDNKLYRCIIAVTKPGPFDPSHWVRTTVSAEKMR